MQPQSTVTCVPHAFRFAAGTLPGRRRVPAQFPRLSRSEQGRSKLTYVKKEDLATVRQHCAAYRAFQQNLKEWRRVTAAVEAVAAGPVPIKHFYLFLSISLDIGPPVCHI